MQSPSISTSNGRPLLSSVSGNPTAPRSNRCRRSLPSCSNESHFTQLNVSLKLFLPSAFQRRVRAQRPSGVDRRKVLIVVSWSLWRCITAMTLLALSLGLSPGRESSYHARSWIRLGFCEDCSSSQQNSYTRSRAKLWAVTGQNTHNLVMSASARFKISGDALKLAPSHLRQPVYSCPISVSKSSSTFTSQSSSPIPQAGREYRPSAPVTRSRTVLIICSTE